MPKLYPKQHKAIWDAARYTLIEATTKAGKTVGCLVWILTKAWNGKDGQNFWWIAPVTPQAKIAYRRLKRMLKQYDESQTTWDPNETELKITLANGACIWFKGSDNPDNLYGEDVYAAVIDEASRCKEESWHAVRSTLTATKAPVKIIGNVRGRKNWAYRLARKAQSGEPNMAYHKLTAWDAVEGGILEASEIEDARRILPLAVFNQLYLAEPSDDGGNPFGIDAIQKCIAPMSMERPVMFGVDLAKSRDWTVVIGLDKNGYVCRLRRWQGDWAVNKREILQMVGRVPTLVDSTGVGDPIVEEMHKTRANIKGFKFTTNSKQQIMEGLAASIQMESVHFPEGWLSEELESFEYTFTAKNTLFAAPEGATDDGVCALALANKLRKLTRLRLSKRDLHHEVRTLPRAA